MCLKYLIEDYCVSQRLSDYNSLTNIIKEGRQKYDSFKFALLPNMTEHFRTEATWLSLKNEVIPKLMKTSTKIKILICGARNSFELSSLNILLDQMKLKDRVQVDIVDFDKALVERFEEETFSDKDFKIADHNYEKLEFKEGLGKYVDKKVSLYSIQSVYKKYDNFYEKELGKGKEVGTYDIVIARDILLYYKKRDHEKLLRWFLYHVKQRHYLILGVKDSVHTTTSRSSVKLMDEEAMVYVKK